MLATKSGTKELLLSAWALSSLLFLSGIAFGDHNATPSEELLIVLLIVVAQTFAVKNYISCPSRKNSLKIYALLFWSVGFVLRSFAVIDDAVYSMVVGLFVAVLILVCKRKC